ncbi:MAG TPA: hypothetical protein PLM53_06465 [Spirochaetota bacterium]|nr:hypothetical protein [Spirochaetota bacterium]HPC39737.1 hypothetical protein [Spirochaetota bacterium]HPL19213.1 hypothetical protein [Spirochaetota bacterium]HQF07465.1 hypothetical protein [Spirochaetota bacterium]HQH96725.1 hypothetical protein [Spirochaetota bacterium]
MRNILFAPLLCIFLLFISIEARSAGIGGYGMFGYGTTALDKNIKPLLFYRKYGNYIAGGGLVIDANCSGPGIFNYRIALGGRVLLIP